jgi:thiol:disulfide interchange protein DsbG
MNSSLVRCCLAGIGALLLALPALGATPAASSSLPPMLAQLVASGKLKVVRQFATEVPGLTGYIVSNRNGNQVVYGEHGYLIVGHVISSKGIDLTDDYLGRFGPKPDYTEVVKSLESSGHLIHEGEAKAPLLYVFADPNCIFCYHFYRMAEPLVASGRLQLRWVMVAFLQQTSGPKAAAILAAQDPRRALHEDEDRFDTAHEAGGIAPARGQNNAVEAVLKEHLSAMDSIGANGTPTLLYRNRHGGWTAQVGLPTQAWLMQYIGGAKPSRARPAG